jgi:hypothetical protein
MHACYQMLSLVEMASHLLYGLPSRTEENRSTYNVGQWTSMPLV